MKVRIDHKDRIIRDHEIKTVNGQRRFEATWQGCGIMIECDSRQLPSDKNGEYYIEVTPKEGCILLETDHTGDFESALKVAMNKIISTYKIK